jgi:hypothetical protein
LASWSSPVSRKPSLSSVNSARKHRKAVDRLRGKFSLRQQSLGLGCDFIRLPRYNRPGSPAASQRVVVAISPGCSHCAQFGIVRLWIGNELAATSWAMRRV